jgi:hypothetical protein
VRYEEQAMRELILTMSMSLDGFVSGPILETGLSVFAKLWRIPNLCIFGRLARLALAPGGSSAFDAAA